MKSLDSIVVRAMETITRSENLLRRGCKKLKVGHSPNLCSSFTSTCFNYISTMSLPATFFHNSSSMTAYKGPTALSCHNSTTNKQKGWRTRSPWEACWRRETRFNSWLMWYYKGKKQLFYQQSLRRALIISSSNSTRVIIQQHNVTVRSHIMLHQVSRYNEIEWMRTLVKKWWWTMWIHTTSYIASRMTAIDTTIMTQPINKCMKRTRVAFSVRPRGQSFMSSTAWMISNTQIKTSSDCFLQHTCFGLQQCQGWPIWQRCNHTQEGVGCIGLIDGIKGSPRMATAQRLE